ncbi:deoxyguanosinetriphosphate triphosphohydrolase [Alteromonas antoniana]|uniref:deoxyguanosinetriphosphate triphosphohydrolase n=1 Tax=Alteromonas antoniana TaxID=2803813 RepID=UPI001C439859|nr:deoxyguanosinetriphosphate triphosphohydrolase [Alteromonas antoniana]
MTHSHQMIQVDNVVQLPLPFEGYPGTGENNKGWSYLLAESVAFKKDVMHGIRIQKPNQEKVPGWIQRIIESGQCNTIYVENLSLNEAEKSRIQSLCQKYSVSVVNLTIAASQHEQQNVVIGPW